jgi:hypothetical protein
MIAELRPEPDSLHLGQPVANMIAIMQMDGTKNAVANCGISVATSVLMSLRT